MGIQLSTGLSVCVCLRACKLPHKEAPFPWRKGLHDWCWLGILAGCFTEGTLQRKEESSLLQGMHQAFLHPKLPKGACPGALPLNTFHCSSLKARTTKWVAPLVTPSMVSTNAWASVCWMGLMVCVPRSFAAGCLTSASNLGCLVFPTLFNQM